MSVKGRRYRQVRHPPPNPLAEMAAFVEHRRVMARAGRNPRRRVDPVADEPEDTITIEEDPRGRRAWDQAH